MDTSGSDTDHFLFIMSSIAKHIAERIKKSDWGLKVAAVGLNTIRQPMKPPKLASHLSLPTFSPRSTLANSILKKGIVLFTTTAEAKGRSCSPTHQRPMPSASKLPLTACIHSLDVLKPDGCTSSSGRRTSPAHENRMKTICDAVMLPPRNFMIPSLPIPMTKWERYHVIPVMYVDLALSVLASPSAEAAVLARTSGVAGAEETRLLPSTMVLVIRAGVRWTDLSSEDE